MTLYWQRAGANHGLFSKAIMLDEITFRRMTRIGTTGFDPNLDSIGNLESIYNEGFHAWYNQYYEENERQFPWLGKLMDQQTQFGAQNDRRATRHMSEEAMSEMLQQLVATLESKGDIPTYKEVQTPGL